MKSYIILGLMLLICQSNMEVANSEEAATSSVLKNERAFSPRVLVTPIANTPGPLRGVGNPVVLTRKLLEDLHQFNLINEVVQAMHTIIRNKADNTIIGHGLLFEMRDPLMASNVVQASTDKLGDITKELEFAQVKRDFWDPENV